MARGINKVILLGNLGKDPEVRYTANGTAICKFSLATSEGVKNPEGNWDERTEWHRVVAFDKLAERCSSFLSKGKQVYVEGKLRTNQWEDAQGAKHYTTEIVARDILLLSGAGGAVGQTQSNQADFGRPARQAPEGPPLPEYLPPDPGMPDDDIPF
jgi:single-strand DNA-binding protein